jgi:transcriptional regulator with XRE-family HTH domain
LAIPSIEGNNATLAKEESEKRENRLKRQNLIGRNIGRLRYQRGWTQDMLAAKLQLAGWMVSRSKISRIESEQAHVYDFQVFVFADVFDVEVKTLFPKAAFQTHAYRTGQETAPIS